MRILITGSNGFIGKHLTERLGNIVGIDRKTGKEVLYITENDLADIDCVIHLAAQTSVWNEDYGKIVDDNIKAFTHIFFLCMRLGKKFIYASSSCAENMTSLYGLSKKYDEMLSATYNYGIGLRLHNVYGPEPREDTLLARCLDNDKINLWNNGENIRHFTYVGDVCRAFTKAIFELNDGLYNVVNPVPSTTLQFCQEVQKYKPLEITLVDEKRKLDKEYQKVDGNVPNLLCDYLTIDAGIKRIMEGR